MLRLSDYIININLEYESEILLIHGYTGAIITLKKEEFFKLQNGKDSFKTDFKISSETLEVLKQKGFLTNYTQQQEKEIIKNIIEDNKKIFNKSINILIAPTYNCNFRCSYCYQNYLLKNGKTWLETTMTTENIDCIFSNINHMEKQGVGICEQIVLFGGEPLLKENYPLIRYILNHCKKAGKKLYAFTNGYDLNHYEDLLGNGKIEGLEITIDGLEEKHNNYRYLIGKQPTFDTIISNLDMAIKKGVEIYVRSNIDSSNIDDIKNLYDYFKEKDWVDKQNFKYYCNSKRSCCTCNEKEMINKEIEEIDKKIMTKVNNINSEKVQSYPVSFKERVLSLFTTTLELKENLSLTSVCCDAPKSMVFDCFNNIYPCADIVGKKEYSVGNICKNEIVLSKSIEQWNKSIITNIKKCIECKYSIFCSGGCPIHSLDSNGSIKESWCEQFKNIFDECMVLAYKNCNS